jgi:peptidoglycan/LPS O-acetylase OafA/YrhL
VSPAARARFPGLDTLRFLAASFVVLGHIPLNQESLRLPHPAWGAFFYRGSPAVSFFFTLSGFLITYLLLDEGARTGTIAVRTFYLRRVCRIWPLYFAVVFAGLFVYNALLPRLGIPYRVEYALPLALVLYGALLPNLMNSLYTVGGILNPLWSIGVEEQFYLVWAPAVKRFRRHLPALCWAVLGASFALFSLARLDVFGPYRAKGFVGQLRFHYMAAGALAAWALHERRAAFLAWAPFTRRALQAVLLLLLLDYYLATFIHWGWLGDEALQLVLYPWLIVEVGANPRRLVRLGSRATEYLGTISYGIYMLHMFAVYATSAAFRAAGGARLPLPLFLAAYYAMAFGLTFLLAHLSHRWLERPFLRFKDRRLAAPAPPPPAALAAEG